MRKRGDDRHVAVITGSTAGIGLATAHALAQSGYHVVVSSRRKEHVEKTVKDLQDKYGEDAVSGIVCNVSRIEDRARLVLHVRSLSDRVQALVSNVAASTILGPVLNTTEADWDKMFDVNVKSAFFLIKDFSSMLHAGSSVVIVTSIAAYNPLPGLGTYSITKTALLGLTKVLAGELGTRGIRVNSVAPGIIKTKFSEVLWNGEHPHASNGAQSRRESTPFFHIPLKRLGEVGDVSGVIAFLVSKDAAYITGETIVMAGGALSKL